MKKRLFAVLLALTLALSLLPVAVFADGEDAAASNAQQEQQQQPVCVCEAACTAEGMNADCPICGAEGAAVERCGKYAAPAEDKAAQPADEEQPDTGAPDADKPAVEPAVQSADQGIAIQAAHTHCICGGNVNAGDHTAHSDVTYTAWNGTGGISYTNNTAYVYLTGNATINSDLIVDGKTLHLCLNGKTLSSNGEKKIKVRNNARLVLCDCQGGGTFKGATKNVWGGACIYLYTSTLDMFGGKLTGGKVTGKGGGGAIAMEDHQCIFNMYGGEISGNNGNNYGGAIFRKFDANKPNTTGGAFNMYGGTIKNNTAKNGGAFFSTTGGSINLTGGTISGNKATMSSNNAGGGAIYMRGCGTITITGSAKITGNSSSLDGGAILMGWGTITISDSARLTGNTASRWGGAICLCTDANKTSVLNMTGGEISGNKAAEGGAVEVLDANCTFNLSGGKIINNSSSGDGGAIYLNQEPSVLNMTGGEISGNTATGNGGGVYIYRSGSVCNLSGGTIESNTAGKNGGAVYINKGALKISGTPIIKNNTVSGKANNVSLPSGKTLTISGAISSGASIGVTTENTNYPVVFSNAYDTDYSGYFFSDAGKEILYNSSKQLEIGKNIVHTCSGGTATCMEKAVCSTCGKPYGTVDANNHDWGAWTSNSDGTHTRTCSRSASHTETLPHADENSDHICDACGKIISNHEDANKDHICDVCGKTVSNHEDANNDHLCDVCGKTVSNHEDANKDHKCDTCGKVISNHEDTNNDHKCDVCGKTVSNHEDTNNDHICDVCGKTVSNHEDTNNDHKCDVCGKTVSNHEDTNNDHICDVCGKTVSNHEDANKDHKCDTCGKVISNHTGGKANCHAKAVCEICQLAYGEKNPANHDGGTELRNARAATYTSTGYTGDTYCKGCNTKLSSGTVIPKLSSGAPAPVKPAAPGKTVQSGKTGDAGVALYAGMALLSLTGCAWLRRKGK